jgi:hypothetical protein
LGDGRAKAGDNALNCHRFNSPVSRLKRMSKRFAA